MQSASLGMVQTCLLSSRPLSISTCFLATIITLHFAHICIYFSAWLNSSPSSCLQQGHIHVSHGSDLITFRPSSFVCVSFPMEISVLIPYGKTLICESLAFFSFTMHHLTFFFKFSNTNPFFESSSCLKMCWNLTWRCFMSVPQDNSEDQLGGCSVQLQLNSRPLSWPVFSRSDYLRTSSAG